MKLSICFSISWFDLWPLLDLFAICCNYSLCISVQLMHHLLCSFISFWRKLYAILDHFLYFPSGVLDQTCELSTYVFNLLFNSFIKDSHKIVKLPWVSTKYIYIYFWSRLLIRKFAHHLCNIDIIISPQIVCMFLAFDTVGSHVTSIMNNVTWHHCLFAMYCFCGSLKMIVLYFWTSLCQII